MLLEYIDTIKCTLIAGPVLLTRTIFLIPKSRESSLLFSRPSTLHYTLAHFAIPGVHTYGRGLDSMSGSPVRKLFFIAIFLQLLVVASLYIVYFYPQKQGTNAQPPFKLKWETRQVNTTKRASGMSRHDA